MSEAQQHRAPLGVDDDLALLTEQIEALTALAGRDDVGENEIYDVSIRWGAALAGRLPRLVHYSVRGMLNEADEASFQAVCADLRGLAGVIDRYRLAQPVFADAPPAKSKRFGGRAG